jgi:hypothetical protein
LGNKTGIKRKGRKEKENDKEKTEEKRTPNIKLSDV